MDRNSMTPVDRFAKSAMQACMETWKYNYLDETEHKRLAEYSYVIADAMMAEKYKRDTNLCDKCTEHFAVCNSDPTFGLGLGCDNIIKCKSYRTKDNHRIKTFFRRLYFSVKNKLIRKVK